MAIAIVEVERLPRVFVSRSRRSKPTVALDDLSPQVEADETHGLLAVRRLLDGRGVVAVTPQLCLELAVAAAWLAVSWLSMIASSAGRVEAERSTSDDDAV